MAHTGFLYPVEQRLRYLHNKQVWAYYLAASYRCRGYLFEGSIALPTDLVFHDAFLYNWTPGDAFCEFRAPLPTAGPEECQIGFRYELTETYNTSNRRWGTLWVDGVRQYDWHAGHDNPPFAGTPVVGGGQDGRVAGWVLACDGEIQCFANGY